MVEIVIKVTDCRQCPYCQAESTKTAAPAYDAETRLKAMEVYALLTSIEQKGES